MKKTDYSNRDNWLKLPEITKDVDTIYIYPTAYIDPTPGAVELCGVDHPEMRATAAINYKKMAVAYEESTNVFVPFYRQVNLAAVVGMSEDDLGPKEEQISDLYGALDYYFEHYNNGRPFILAGHSQGSSMLKDVILPHYMKEHPDYYRRMIAAYAIGFSITKELLAENPHLKFAERADDTGVIVSWNTEGAGNHDKRNVVVLKGAVAINPINWKRDETYAPASDNLGSVFYNEVTQEYKTEIPGVADARVDIDRGVVVRSPGGDYSFMSVVEGVMGAMFGPESYHDKDYGFYFKNIQENVRTRIAAFHTPPATP